MNLSPGDVGTLKSSSDPIEIPLTSSGVWRVKETVFSAVFPPGMEPSPFLVDRCREIDPGFCVVWCWKVMVTPANTEEKLGHYVICRYVPSWDEKFSGGKEPIKLGVVPASFPFDPKRIFELESWTSKWPKGSAGAKLGLPDLPKPFDERVLAYVEAQEWIHKHVRVEEAIEALRDIFKADEKELESVVAEAEYELKQHWKAMKKAVEEKNMLPPVFEKKPFVETAKPSEST